MRVTNTDFEVAQIKSQNMISEQGENRKNNENNFKKICKLNKSTKKYLLKSFNQK